MRTRYALLLCLLPGLALGQSAGSITISETSDLDNGGKNDGVINIAECKGTPSPDTVALAWTLTTVPASGTYYKVYATTQSCPTPSSTPSTGIVDLTKGFQATGGSQTGSWPASGSLGVLADILTPLGVGCSTTTNVNICVTVYDSGQASVQDVKATAVLKVDIDQPAAPTGVSAGSGDSALHVSWTAGSGGVATATSFTATATAVAPDATHVNCNAGGVSGRSCTVTSSSSNDCRITGLTNYACYDVTVVGYSDTKNPSPTSLPAPGVPMPVDDFWRLYSLDGGREQGGCGQGAAGLLALAPLLLLAPRLRRRRP